MKYILSLIIILTFNVFSFVELQYMKTPKHHFEFYAQSSSMGTDDGQTTPATLGLYGGRFYFDTLAYGFNLFPAKLPNGDTFTWTTHNLYLQLYEDISVFNGVFNLSTQLGLLNIGLPKTALGASRFKNYFQDYYITNRIQPFKIPFYLYISNAV